MIQNQKGLYCSEFHPWEPLQPNSCGCVSERHAAVARAEITSREMQRIGRELAKASTESLNRIVAEAYMTDGPLSRGTDPVTSHLAERELRASGKHAKQQRYVLDIVTRYPGSTAREYDEEGTYTYGGGAFHRRLVELERKGLVRRGEVRKCRIGNRLAHTWYPQNAKSPHREGEGS